MHRIFTHPCHILVSYHAHIQIIPELFFGALISGCCCLFSKKKNVMYTRMNKLYSTEYTRLPNLSIIGIVFHACENSKKN